MKQPGKHHVPKSIINSALFSKRTTNYRKLYLTLPDVIGKKNQNFKIKGCKTLPMSNAESNNKNRRNKGWLEYWLLACNYLDKITLYLEFPPSLLLGVMIPHLWSNRSKMRKIKFCSMPSTYQYSLAHS